jgi:CHAD domain-containing protein
MTQGPAVATATAAPMAGPYLAARLRALLERLRETAPRVVDSAQDADAIHDLRVALRRTRTVLGICRPLVGRFHADAVRRALRSVMVATGALRDDEVVLELLESLGVDHPGVVAWLSARKARERRLRASVARLVREGELDRGLVLLEALLAFPLNPRRDRRLSKFARRAVDRARREVERRKTGRVDDAPALHRLRIAHKRLRYTAETLAEGLPPELAALAQRSARFQSRLGDIHDVDVAIVVVRRARALPDDARAELLAALDRERSLRISVYIREIGVVAASPRVQAAGGESLRKISTR